MIFKFYITKIKTSPQKANHLYKKSDNLRHTLFGFSVPYWRKKEKVYFKDIPAARLTAWLTDEQGMDFIHS